MRLITKLAILFYTALIVMTTLFIGLFVTHLITLDSVMFIANMVYSDEQLRTISGCVAMLVFFINWFFIDAMIGKEVREKNIAFENPIGRVTVSLIAMEDLVRRICLKFREVKDVRSVRIKAHKRGLDIRLNLALYSDVKIPKVTADLQEIVKHKVIETIWVKPNEPFIIPAISGIEDKVTVKIYVTKIVGDDIKIHEKSKKISVEDIDSTVPFQGYRA